jgi:hypothetical protein
LILISTPELIHSYLVSILYWKLADTQNVFVMGTSWKMTGTAFLLGHMGREKGSKGDASIRFWAGDHTAPSPGLGSSLFRVEEDALLYCTHCTLS